MPLTVQIDVKLINYRAVYNTDQSNKSLYIIEHTLEILYIYLESINYTRQMYKINMGETLIKSINI